MLVLVISLAGVSSCGDSSSSRCTNGATNPPDCDLFDPCANGANNPPDCDLFDPCTNNTINPPFCNLFEPCTNGMNNPPLCDQAVPESTYGDITGRQWPQAYGQPHLCLWKDDALAAISFTIDDNTAPDHSWWIEQGNNYGYRFTWFVITGRVDTGSYWGTWQDYADLHALGHDIQSHTVTHLSGELDLDTEYGESRQAIEANIPGVDCLTLAYPGGSNMENDPEIARSYYVGARGTVGHLNQADNIDYLQTNSISSFNYETDHWASIVNMLQYNPDRPNSYRAWQCMHFHQISDIADELIQGFDYVQDNASEFWVGLFREVILYSRQRDTATLWVRSVSADQLCLELVDEMDDAIFDFPLTVKVRLDDSWTDIHASQDGQEIEAYIIVHENNPYALVSVVPDHGPVTISKTQ